jgi:hypothetical protein
VENNNSILSRLQRSQSIFTQRMDNFLAGGGRFAPVDYSLPPDNLDTNIVQPTNPIVMYCFITSIDKNNNKTYKCKQCGHEFKGQPCNVGSHFKPGFSSQEVRQCKTKFPQLPMELQQQINDSMKEKSSTSSRKRQHALQFDASTDRGQTDIGSSFKTQLKPYADAMVLKFAVTQGASPHSLASDDFMEMIQY